MTTSPDGAPRLVSHKYWPELKSRNPRGGAPKGVPLDDEINCTLDFVAHQLGITKQSAAYLERTALKKCREYIENRGIMPGDVL